MMIDGVVPLLNVEDIDRSIAFYTTALPFQLAQKTEAAGRPVWALLQAGPVKLMLNRPDHADSTARRRRPSYGDVVLYITVDSARDCHEKLRAKGIAAGDISLEAYGMEEFLLRDPDGYEVAIASPMVRIA